MPSNNKMNKLINARISELNWSINIFLKSWFKIFYQLITWNMRVATRTLCPLIILITAHIILALFEKFAHWWGHNSTAKKHERHHHKIRKSYDYTINHFQCNSKRNWIVKQNRKLILWSVTLLFCLYIFRRIAYVVGSLFANFRRRIPP